MDLQIIHVFIGGTSAFVGAAGGLIAGVWRIAHIDADLRKDSTQDIAELSHEFKNKIGELTMLFDETFRGIRQKINDVELDTHRNFVSKHDFDDFRREYREDMRDVKNSLASIHK